MKRIDGLWPEALTEEDVEILMNFDHGLYLMDQIAADTQKDADIMYDHETVDERRHRVEGRTERMTPAERMEFLEREYAIIEKELVY